ncbi:MAG: hypothetical protein HY769_00725 [Candidatus Stahlbacteria bacterium]|nr:hypothetical protein [Candidatus Stahlbacteria bacterium]
MVEKIIEYTTVPIIKYGVRRSAVYFVIMSDNLCIQRFNCSGKYNVPKVITNAIIIQQIESTN